MLLLHNRLRVLLYKRSDGKTNKQRKTYTFQLHCVCTLLHIVWWQLRDEDGTTANWQIFTGQAFSGSMFYMRLTALYV